MEKKQAQLLDLISSTALINKDEIAFTLEETSIYDEHDYAVAGSYLKDNKYGEYLGCRQFRIFDRGLSFFEENRPVGFFNKEINNDKDEEKKHQLTDKQIANLKWQPLLIALSIVSTLSAIIFAYLNFKK